MKHPVRRARKRFGAGQLTGAECKRGPGGAHLFPPETFGTESHAPGTGRSPLPAPFSRKEAS